MRPIPTDCNVTPAELVAMAPDVIVANGGRALAAVQKESRKFPVIFATLTDPRWRPVMSTTLLPRPGGNVTGFPTFDGSYSPKLLEALQKMVPKPCAGRTAHKFGQSLRCDSFWGLTDLLPYHLV